MGKNPYAYSSSLLRSVPGLCIPSHQLRLPADVVQGSLYYSKGCFKAYVYILQGFIVSSQSEE